MSDTESEHRIKINMFGFQASGKTCLYNIWRGLNIPDEYIKTTEMEFEKITVNVDGLKVPVLLSDWGYEVMVTCSTSQQTTINAYSENTDIQIFVIALNSIDSYEFVEGAPNSVFFKTTGEVQQVAILNKIDLEEDEDLRSKIKTFSDENEIPIFEVTTTNPELCRKTLIDIIDLYLENNPQYKQSLKKGFNNKKSTEKTKKTSPSLSSSQSNKTEKQGCCTLF
ncbi:hypothetical protein ENUP19_0057G0070 [Entamoeba nuttalli]|uniref:Small GTP-binding protein domain containing protein n=2 Tax=Entamoeba nuttalli TaxID=412467 RepID=K2H045_ENTNP|nr:small GTP-binding protein domain containing protein [Entamoeba nuttalli P19]EKE40833.1 small GTP-binding protein domain containing protein [Entamoeba nuttalli P19]|eukprot:XP_008856843.1 small GTP-binding protein domain containing protein [Entamoeba nuttalli P19]